MGVQYVQVMDDDGDEPIELPSEEDGTLLLTTLAAQYPGACGLQYRNPETGARRGIRLAEGKLHPPDGQWKDMQYICVFPKANKEKREVKEKTIDRGMRVRSESFDKESVASDRSIDSDDFRCSTELKKETTNGSTHSDEIPSVTENKRKGDDGLENPTAKTKRVEKRKCSDLIVLGLPWKSSEDDIRKYFEQFGEVIMVQIKRDPHTKQSRGYGFIRFSEYDSQLTCLKKRHLIDGRWCEVRIPNSKVSIQEGPRKVFVGRTTEDMTADDLRTYFSRFGEVLDVFIPKPFRAFAFVTFSDSDVAKSLLGEDHLINGCSVHISQAAPKNTDKNDQRKNDHLMQNYKGGQNWGGGQGGKGHRGGNMDMSMGSNMGMTMGMGPGMGPFQLNPAVVAAALGQAGLGLLNFANQGGNQGPPSDSSGYGNPSSGGHGFSNQGGHIGSSHQSSSQSQSQGGPPSQNSGSPGANLLGWGGGPPTDGPSSSAGWGGSNKANWN